MADDPEAQRAVRRAIEGWKQDPAPLRLACGVQPYAWGQRGASAFIPRLLGHAAAPGLPYAEMWMGAHPVLPSHAVWGDHDVPLDRLIAAAPDVVLGPAARAAFGDQLPFLMKVLAAERPLSIQAHPDDAQAAAGFAREEALGIPRDDARRNYRDPRHKPELIVALSPFVALKGFRPLDQIASALVAAPELACLRTPELASLRDLFARCLAPEADDVARGLDALVLRLEAEDRAHPFPASAVEHWLLRAARQLGTPPGGAGGGRDRGLLAFYLLELVELAPGQALFLGPGELHAYLEGVGIEVMASSDNVLRGGLTPKHVDVAELLRILTFASGKAEVLALPPDGAYRTPAREFETRAVVLGPSERWRGSTAGGPAVVIDIEGDVAISAGSHGLVVPRGGVVLIPAALGNYDVAATNGPSTVFATTVPARN